MFLHSHRQALLALALIAGCAIHSHAQSTVAGIWHWQGTAGWQRISMDLKVSGRTVTGTIRMGPGSAKRNVPAADWEYFFEPAVFSISNGKLEGNTVTFEQVLGVNSSPRAERLKYSGVITTEGITFARETTRRPNDPFAIGEHRVQFTVSRTATAQSSPLLEPIPQAPAQTSPVQTVDVAVFNTSGQQVKDLRAEDFALSENGKTVSILKANRPDTPTNLLLMFDHNLTWLQDHQRTQSRNYVINMAGLLLQASTRFLSGMAAADKVAISAFEDSVQTILDWRGTRTGQAQAVPFNILIQPPRGQKDLYGAIQTAIAKFSAVDGAETGRKRVVIFTDGRDGRLSPKWLMDEDGREVLDPLFGMPDSGEAAEFEETVNRVRQSGVRFYFVAVNTDHDPEFGPAIVPRRISGLFPGSDDTIASYLKGVRARMERLAEESGGRVFYGNTPEDAISLFASLHNDLGIGRAYTLEFPSSPPHDGTYRQLEIRSLREGLVLSQYRAGYYAR